MQFADLNFIVRFLPIFLLCFYLAPVQYKNYIIIFGSVIFFGLGEGQYLIPLLIIGIINYYLICNMHKDSWIPWIIILSNITLLLIFKASEYYMPGVSFLIFQMVALTFDLKKRGDNRLSPQQFGVYTFFFPRMISGPITRYENMKYRIAKPKASLSNLEQGLSTFVIGLSYKVILADSLAGLWRDIQSIGFVSISSPLAWMGMIGYSLELYFDFQGYSLMAIGMGTMLGFHLPENFRFPYCASSISDFFRRWHMTLGYFFRDYVYIPLGGSREGYKKTIRNLFIVWAATAVWHGMKWNYLIWGFVLFAIITIEKMGFRDILKRHKFAAHVYVLFVIPFTWMIFAITDLSDIAAYVKRLFGPLFGLKGINVNPLDFIKDGRQFGIYILVGIIFCLPWPERWIRKNLGKWYVVVLLFVLFWCSIFGMTRGIGNPFLYFKF